MSFAQFVAIDWSGAVGLRHAGIAVARCDAGMDAPTLVRAGHRWSRTEVRDWLRTDCPPGTLIGMDLGFALPFADADAYFPGAPDQPADARALWALVDRVCADDADLGASSFVADPRFAPYFRRQGVRTTDAFGARGGGRLRVTERAQRDAGLNPYSNFNLVGAAQVGKSSLTGMRLLHALDGAMPIWPFDAPSPGQSCLVEIYTALAAVAAGRRKGATKMRDAAALNVALATLGSGAIETMGPISDHAADALVTAACLRRAGGVADNWTPAAMTRAVAATEGWTFGIG